MARTGSSPYQTLTSASVTDATEDWLLDFDAPGLPLVITFGHYGTVHEPAMFSYYGRLKKMELLTGQKVNKLLIRDAQKTWYCKGIAGLGQNPHEVATSLKELMEPLQPSRICLVGESMGAYGAILYGALLNADYVLAFGALSGTNVRLHQLLNDRRWEPAMLQLASDKTTQDYSDLPSLLKELAPAMQVDLVYGLDGGPGHDAVCLDAAHAIRFESVSRAQLLPLHYCGHVVLEHIKQHKLLDTLFAKKLLNIDIPFTAWDALSLDNSWKGWLLHNYCERGARSVTLVAVLEKNGIPPDTAKRYVEAMHVRRFYEAL